MSNILGIINLNEKENHIKELTYNRPIGSIPFAGRYRLIDFTLSNMVNSGITNVFIFTRDKYRSLIDHIETGRSWDLDRKNEGLFIFNPIQNFFSNVRRSDMDIIRDYTDYIYHSRAEYVVISPSYMISTVNYKDVLKYHIAKEADITVLYKKLHSDDGEFEGCDSIAVDKDGLAIDLIHGRKNRKNVFMEMFIMKRKLFLDIINKRILGADHDLIKDSVFQLKNNLKIYAYEYKGYLACINSIKSYFNRSLDLLSEDTMSSLFFLAWPIYTKVKDEPPTKYELNADVKNSIIAGGCRINGNVENSIMFRRVNIDDKASVKSCVLMQNSRIEKNAILEYVILDKNSVVTEGKVLKGTKDSPVIVEKGQII